MELKNLSKNQFKFIQSLKLKKFRQKYNKFIVEGHKMVSELQNDFVEKVDLIVATEAWIQEHQKPMVHYVVAKQKELESLSQFKNASAVLAITSTFEYEVTDMSMLTQGRYVLVDQLNDPGNGGTICRLADWFGLDGVLLTHGSVDVYNHKFVQSSMGAIFRVPCMYVDLNAVLNEKNINAVATSLSGDPLTQMKFPEHFILLFGSESHGLSTETIAQCGSNVQIENTLCKGAESLNVGVSAGIILYAASMDRL